MDLFCLRRRDAGPKVVCMAIGAVLAANMGSSSTFVMTPARPQHVLQHGAGSIGPAAKAGASAAPSAEHCLALAAGVVSVAALSLGSRLRRSPGTARQNSVVALAAEDTSSWFPRTTGWTSDELAAVRQQIEAEAGGAPAGYDGPRYTGPSSVTPEFIDSLISMQEKGGILPREDAYKMVMDVIDVLRSENTMGKVSIPSGQHLTIVGDIHGQYWDFMNMLSLTGKPSPESPFIFNGDFVDRGSWSIEVIMVIFAFKLKDPASVFLNRGNHEMIETNILYGFCGECGEKYDMGLFDLFSEAFRLLPLCHLVEDKVLVLHAGLPGPEPRIWMPGQTHDPTDAIPATPPISLEELAAVDRYMEVTPEAYPNSIGPTTDEKLVMDTRKLIDLLWSDPRGGVGYGPSYRKGKGVYMFGPDVTESFCKKNNLQAIVRSHEVKADGFRWDHPQLLTVFSAPNYLDTGNNKAAFLKVTQPSPGGDLEIEQVTFAHVPHPDLAPMSWQVNITENYPHLLRKMKKKEAATFDEFGDSDFEGLMNFDEWEPDEADQFQEAFRVDQYGRDLPPK